MNYHPVAIEPRVVKAREKSLSANDEQLHKTKDILMQACMAGEKNDGKSFSAKFIFPAFFIHNNPTGPFNNLELSERQSLDAKVKAKM